MNPVLKKLLKIFIWILSIIFVLLIAVFIFIQTDTFNNLALNYASSKLNESWAEKDNKISVKSLKGNILTGLTLDSGEIYVDRDTLIKFNSIDLKYDIWGLLSHQIRISHIIINSPDIYLTKFKDPAGNLAWNFSKLFSSSGNRDTSASAFDWDITVNKFKIENGLITSRNLNDSVLSTGLKNEINQKQSQFNLNNFLVSDLNLELNADYTSGMNNVSMDNMTFNTNSDFNVKKFTFNAAINLKDTVTSLTGLELITDRSRIKLNEIVMKNFNPLDSNTFLNFGDKDFKADINLEKIDFSDLHYFIPETGMLDSSLSLSLNANGKYGNFNLSGLALTLPNSFISLAGNVKNLDNPENLYLDIEADKLDILVSDIKTIYKDPSFPDYSNLGRVKADIHYTGSFNNFYTKYNIASDAGSAEGYLNFNSDEKNYDGIIRTTNLDIGKILKDKSLSGNINLNAEFSGSGFDPAVMSASVKYNLSSSSFAGYYIKTSGGMLSLIRNNIFLNLRNVTGFGNFTASGGINISNMNNPVYSLRGKVNNLNVAGLTRNNNDRSNLNFSYDIKGSGISLENINGQYKFNIEDSYFADNLIPQTPLDIEINNSKEGSSYTLSSDILDLRVNGNFKIESAGKVISSNLGLISEKFKSKFSTDSSSKIDTPVSYNIAFNEPENFNLEYELKLKDTAVSNRILQPLGILFNGNISGTAANDNSRFSLTSVMNVKDFSYMDTVIILKNFNSDISLSNAYQSSAEETSLSPIEIKIKTTGDKISFQNLIFDSVKVNAGLSNSLADLRINAKQDSVLSAYINGHADLSGNVWAAKFDSIDVKYKTIPVTNDKDWIIDYTPGEKIDFKQVAARSKDLLLTIGGKYELTGSSDLTLQGNEFPLQDIYSLIYPVDTSKVIVKKKYPVSGKLQKLFVNFKGSTDDPDLTLDIVSGKLMYASADENLDIGNMTVKANYKDETASADIRLNNGGSKSDTGSLSIHGMIPYANPLDSNASLSNEDVQGKSADMKITSKNFQLKYFLKMIPSLPEISGKMNGEITATGNAASPDLKGSITINDGDFYYDMTGMDYKFKLKTSTENSKLQINNLSLSSINDDSKHFDIFGNIDFSGMKINDIDLSTSGDMVFLDKDVTQNDFGVYGYLWAGSGVDPLKIKGNLDKLKITGQLLIKDAKISSVPFEGSGYDNKTDNFTYVSVSDTSYDSTKVPLMSVEENDYYKINPFARYKYELSGHQTSAADFLDMDVNVKTEKNIYVSIDFNNLTKDRLFGEISADLKLKTKDKEIQAVGDVNIVKNSYYRFYKDFKLNDSKISFNGPITNPVLDIQAVYTGVKNTTQFGIVASEPVEVMLTIKGELDKPDIKLKLIENGSTVSGSDAQADAITFLLFGKFKNELSTSQRTAVASSLGTGLGSLYISSIVSQTVRNILPFLIDAQFQYSQGNIKDANLEFTSELGGATIKVGGKLLKEIRNFEFVIDYPLNDFLNLNLPETLMLELSRQEENDITFGSSETTTNTGIKILYRIKY